MLTFEEAERKLAARGDGHVLRWFDSLSATGQQRLLEQIETLDLEWLDRVLAAPARPADPSRVTPLHGVLRGGDPADDEAQAAGCAALRAGRVACLLVAGGQGTRLGFDGPKGAYPIGAVSGRTLFELHVERLLGLGRRHGVVPPLYVMTSPANHQATCALFAEQQRFGLAADRLLIFPQGEVPAVDQRGHLLLAARDRIAMAPDGNGGLFAALARSGALDDMAARGVEALSYVQVDNALAPSCDPRFVGHHLLRGAAFSCKAMPKRGAAENVGNFALVDGRPTIIEYTEIPEALATAVDARGELLFNWANPGLFVFSRAFVTAQAARTDLPFHLAHKKIPHLDERGALVTPKRPSGFKLESFALDTLPDAERVAIVDCERDAEFAPVKNAAGSDSPQSARALMTALYRRWIAAAGGALADDGQVEISARYAVDAEELAQRLPHGFSASGDVFLE